MENVLSPLVARLKRLRLRLALRQLLEYWLSGVFFAGLGACFWLAATRLFPVLGDALWAGLAALAAGVAVAAIVAFLRRPNLMQAALAADLRLGLRERLSSSYELAQAEGPMVAALHRDAERHLSRLKDRRDFPLVPRRGLRWFALPFIIFGIGYVLFPELDLFGYRERQVEARQRAEALAAKVEKLNLTADVLRRTNSQSAPAAQAEADQLKLVAEELQTGKITEKQALARVNSLAEQLQKQREALEENQPQPQLAEANKLTVARHVAEALQNGRTSEAAQKLKDLKKKLQDGKISQKQKEALAKDLQSLAEMMGGASKPLNAAVLKALSQADANLSTEDMNAALEAMELSMEDMASVLDQLAKLDSALGRLAEWKSDLLGPSEFCRCCGRRIGMCKHCGNCRGGRCSHCGNCGLCAACGRSLWAAGEADKAGNGMGRPGMGRGGQVGELPENVNVDFQPTVLPGGMTQGKMLANMLEKTAPEQGAEPTTDYVSGTFTAVRQEAEQALTKEDIPRGSREFVRQYFGSLETSGSSE